MRCRHGGADRSVNNYRHHPEASFIFRCYTTIVVVPSSVNVSAMDGVDANEGPRRQLHEVVLKSSRCRLKAEHFSE